MVSFKLFAGTNVGLRSNNEDNFTVCPNLERRQWITPTDSSDIFTLSEKGCVMVVADGMGGQNAGEVASALAIEVVQKMFSPEIIPADKLKDASFVKNYLKEVVYRADIEIKNYAKKNPKTEGMGSTIVIAWLLNDKIYVAWLGDSRAYSHMPQKGIGRISKDHSLVQQLVDKGLITDDEAMNHPNSNIITRSLGDTSQRAKPDVAEYDIEDGEVILLCSDGLCGVCRDEDIGSVIDNERENLKRCKESLTSMALAAGGSDNITIALLRIFKADDIPQILLSNSESSCLKQSQVYKYKWYVIGCIICIAAIIICLSLKKTYSDDSVSSRLEFSVINSDTLMVGKPIKYTIKAEGKGCNYKFDYDSTLISIDKASHSIFLNAGQSITKDLKTRIKVYSILSENLCDSVIITIRKEENDSSVPLKIIIGTEGSEIGEEPEYTSSDKKGEEQDNTNKVLVTTSDDNGAAVLTNSEYKL